MKILVLGATGFIGRNIVDYLESKGTHYLYCHARVNDKRCRSISGGEWFFADLMVADQLTILPDNVDVVLQFAASTGGGSEIKTSRLNHIYQNAVINSNLLDYVVRSNVRHFVFPSCTTIYQSTRYPVREEDYSRGTEFFEDYRGSANVKAYVEDICKVYSQITSTRFTILRHSNLYGPYDKYGKKGSHVCADLIHRVSICNPVDSLYLLGDGSTERDLLHVSDFCRAIELVISEVNDAFRLFNVGSGALISIKKLAQTIVEASSKNIDVVIDKNKKASKSFVSCLNSEKIRCALGWTPKMSIEAGISQTLKWVMENGKAL